MSCVKPKYKYFLYSFRSIYKEDKKRKKKYSNRTGTIRRSQRCLPCIWLSPSQYRTWLLLEGVCTPVLQERTCSLSHKVICKRAEKWESNQNESHQGRKGERAKMSSREVRAGNTNSIHDDLLSGICSGNINLKAKNAQPPVLKKIVIFISLF